MLKAILSNINDAELKSRVSINTENPLVVFDERTGADFTVSANISELSYRKVPIKHIHLDGNGIDLNAKGYKFYKKGDYVGFISNTLLSERAASLTLIAPTSNRLSTKGISFYFGNEYPKTISIDYYHSGVYGQYIIASETYMPDSSIFCCEKEVENWDVADISFCFDSPTYFRLYDIRLGVTTEFNRFFDFDMLEEVNVLSDDLSINSCSFTVDSKKDLISLEGGEVQILKDNEMFGVYNLKNCEQVYTNKYTLENYDVISRLEKNEFVGSFFKFEADLLTMISEIEQSAGVEIQIDETFNNYSVYGFLPKCNCRYALTQICWAIGGMVDSSRNDKVIIKPIPTTVSSVIKTSNKRIIGDAIFKKSNPITKAVWKLHNYLCQSDGEMKSLFTITVSGLPNDPSQGQGYEMIRYWDKPTMVTEMGFPNLATLISLPGRMEFVTFYNGVYDFIGAEYVDTVTEIEIFNPEATGNVKENIMTFDKFTLYAKDQNGSYEFKKKQIQKYIRSKGTVTAKIVLKGEKVGDLISIETAFSGTITGIITSMNLSLVYSNVAEIEVLEWNSGTT